VGQQRDGDESDHGTTAQAEADRLEEAERAISDACARALGLDLDSQRILRRITVYAATADSADRATQLSQLSNELAERTQELADVRQEIARLRLQADPHGSRF
jgi:hypothetical protein